MAYDEGFAHRIRELVEHRPAITEKRMFGGLCFLARGHMFAGIVGDTLMARVGPAAYAGALARPHVREMDFTGKPMRGYVFVAPEGLEADAALRGWVDAALDFVGTLPPK